MIRRGLFVLVIGVAFLTAGCATVSHSNVDTQAAARANTMLGLKLLGQKEYEEARNKFERALAYDSNNLRANWGMALVNQSEGKPEQARPYYDKIISQDVRPAILNSYAVFLCRQGQTDRAVKYFRRAADDQRNKAPAAALANAGLCLERSGTKVAAQKYYRKALILDQDQFTALTQMAQIRYAHEQYLSARAFIERADAEHDLSPKLLLLATRIELAMGERGVAQQYLRRHNKKKPTATITVEQLGRSS